MRSFRNYWKYVPLCKIYYNNKKIIYKVPIKQVLRALI